MEVKQAGYVRERGVNAMRVWRGRGERALCMYALAPVTVYEGMWCLQGWGDGSPPL